MFDRIFFFLFLLGANICLSQENISLGTWRFHPSISNGNSIETVDNQVFMSTQNGVLKIDAFRNSIDILTIENTLSSLEPSQLAISPEGVLVIGYTLSLIHI